MFIHTAIQSIRSKFADPKQFDSAAMLAVIALLIIIAPSEAFAATGLPWEKPLCLVAISMKGVVAPALCVVAIIAAGATFAMGEAGGVFKTIMGLLGGSSLALLAVSWLGFLDNTAQFCVGY